MAEPRNNPEAPNDADLSPEERLVAYLDGELDAEGSRRIEELLSTDSELRRTLQRLDRTWELLGELDTDGLPETFTQTTLEMVTLGAADDARIALTEAPRRWRRRWAIVGGGLLAAGLAGFLAVAWLTSDPDRQLVEDLPLLESLDQYRQVDKLEFLQMLSQEGLFVEEEEDDGQ